MTGPLVTDIRYTPASRQKAAKGLLGYLTFLLDGSIRVDGVQMRRTQAGELRLSFPSRLDHRGQEHPYLHPIDTPSRVAIERAVFEALGLEVSP